MKLYGATRTLLLSLLYFAVLAVLGQTLVPFIGPYYTQVLIFIGINITLAVSLNLILGFTGQFSIGHAGFMALGGYTAAALSYYLIGPMVGTGAQDGVAAIVSQNFGLAVALIGGGVAAAIAGILVGIPTLRLRGDYLAIA